MIEWGSSVPTVLALAMFAIAAALAAICLRLHGQRRQDRDAAGTTAAVLDSAPDGYFLWSGATLENPGAASHRLGLILGLDASGDIAFSDLAARFSAEGSQRLLQQVEALARHGTPFDDLLPLAQGGRMIAVRGRRIALSSGTDETNVIWVRDRSDDHRLIADLRADAANRAREADRLRRSLDSLPLPIWWRGADLAPFDANAVYRNATGQRDGAPGELAAIDETRAMHELAARARAAHAPRDTEIHAVIDGRRQYLKITECPLSGGADDKTGFDETIGIAVDMTPVEMVRADLQRHQAVLAEVLERLGAAVAIFGADRSLVYANDAFARQWRLPEGWREAELDYSGLLDHWQRQRLLPESGDFAAYRSAELDYFKNLIEPREDILHLPGGLTLRRVLTPHPFGGLIAVFEDVSDKLALERSHNTLMAVQRGTIDQLQEGIAVFGADGQLQLFNPAFAGLWHLIEAEIADIRLADLMFLLTGRLAEGQAGDRWTQSVLGLLSRSHDAPADASNHTQVEQIDGNVINASAVPLPDGGLLLTHQDVTDTARLARALSERSRALADANRLKSEFFDSVADSLRHPLERIRSLTQADASSDHGTAHAEIADLAAALLSTLEDIADLATVEAGQLTLELDSIDVAAVTESVFGLFRDSAARQNITLSHAGAAEAGWMIADEKRVKQILFKLLNTAISAAGPGGAVHLQIARHTLSQKAGEEAGEQESEVVFETTAESAEGGPPHDPHIVRSGVALIERFLVLHAGRLEQPDSPRGTCIRVVLSAGSTSAIIDNFS